MNKKMFITCLIIISVIALVGFGFGFWQIAKYDKTVGLVKSYSIIDLDDTSESSIDAFSYKCNGFDENQYTTSFTIILDLKEKNESYGVNLELFDEDNFLYNVSSTYTYGGQTINGNKSILIENVNSNRQITITYTISCTSSQYASIYNALENSKDLFLKATATSNEGTWCISKIIDLITTKEFISLAIPSADLSSFVYTGLEQTYNISTNVGYTISNNKRTNAGSQTVIVSLNDGYQWVGGSFEDQSYTFEIAKANPVITGNTDQNYHYTGSSITYNKTNITTNFGSLSYTNDAKTSIGNYSVTISVAESENWNSASVTSNFTIYGILTYNGNGFTAGTVPASQNIVSGTVSGNSGSLVKTSYSFIGWNTSNDGTGTHYDENDSITLTADLTLYAEWSTQLSTYTINFKNYDGTVLETLTCNAGETPIYSGDTPTKVASAQYTYSYSGWSPTITSVTCDQDYIAQFDNTERIYSIKVYFKDKDNQVSLVKTNSSSDLTYNIPVYDFASNNSNSVLSNKKYGDSISLSKQILVNQQYTYNLSASTTGTRYIYAYYVSPVASLDWTKLDNVSGLSYTLMDSDNNYLISVDDSNNMTIVVLCVQAEAIVASSNTIAAGSSTYYPLLSDALAACANVTSTTYLRIYGRQQYESNNFMGACLTSNKSIAQYSFTLDGTEYTVKQHTLNISDYTISGNYTINNNLNVILPNARTNSANSEEVKYKGTNPSTGVCASVSLNGCVLTVNGKLTIGANFETTGISGPYSQLQLDNQSSIIVNNELNAYGYIKEISAVTSGDYYDNRTDSNRYVLVNNGAVVNTIMCIADALSGSALATVVQSGNVCPFWTYDFASLQTFFDFKYGSTLNGKAGLSISSNDVTDDAKVLGTSGSMFVMSSGSELYLEYYNSSCTKVTISGSASIGNISISASGASLNSNNFFLPIPYKYLITIVEGASFSIPKKVKFLNGSKLIIEEDASVEITNEVIFYTVDATTRMGSVSDYKYSSHDTVDSTLLNNGELIVTGNGKLGAFIQHTSENNTASINLQNAGSSSLSVTSKEGSGNVTVTSTGVFYSTDFNDTISAKFTYGGTYSSIYNSSYTNNYYWNGTFVATSSVEIRINDSSYQYPIKDYTIYTNTQASNTNQVTKLENQTTSQIIDDISLGQYIRIDASRCEGATVSINGVSMSYSSSTWYQLTGDMIVTITPSSGTLIFVDTHSDKSTFPSITTGDSESGRSGTTVTVKESTTIGGSSWKEISYLRNDKYSVAAIVRTGYNFQITVQGGTGKNGPLSGTGDYLYYSGVSGTSTELNETQYTNAGFAKQSGAATSSTITMTGTATNTYYGYVFGLKGGSCITEDTMITLADGTIKTISELTYDDKVLSWDFTTGKFVESDIILLINHGTNINEVLHLVFEDNYNIDFIGNHGLFDITTMKFEYLSIDNVEEYVGHEFAIDDTHKVKLLGYSIEEKEIGAYSIYASYSGDVIANGMITMTPPLKEGTEFFGFFDVLDNLTFDMEQIENDIATYGLYDYSDFEAYITYEQFDKLNGKYLKIAVEKGIIDWDQILYLIDFIKPYFE